MYLDRGLPILGVGISFQLFRSYCNLDQCCIYLNSKYEELLGWPNFKFYLSYYDLPLFKLYIDPKIPVFAMFADF